MKKTISILILLILIPTLCFAGSLQEKQKAVIAKKNVAAGSENVGFESVGDTSSTMSNDYIYCTRLTDTPSSNATVESLTLTASAAGDATGAIYLSIYTNGSGKPDDLVANSNVGPIATTYNGGVHYDITHTYTGTKPILTSGATYWICVNNDGTKTNSKMLRTDGTGTCSGTGQCDIAEANAHDNFPANWDSITPDFSNDGRMRGKLYMTISY